MNDLFFLEYDPHNFHCVHFVVRAAKVLFNQDYSQSFSGLMGSLDQTIKTSRSTVHQNKRLEKPKNGCIVLMTYLNESSHVGLFFRHRIFHLTERGVQLATLEQLKPMFKRIRYYEPNLFDQKCT